MPKWYIEANALMDYACNQNGKTIAPNDIARFPKADVQEVKHGNWIKPSFMSERVCSNCQKPPRMLFGHLPDYCPICGAKMDVEDSKEKIDDTDSKASV